MKKSLEHICLVLILKIKNIYKGLYILYIVIIITMEIKKMKNTKEKLTKEVRLRFKEEVSEDWILYVINKAYSEDRRDNDNVKIIKEDE